MTVIGKQRKFAVALFDLDDCLYQNHDVAVAVKRNIARYMETVLNIPQAKVEELLSLYYKEHGTTLAGLAANGYDIDYAHWHEYVHHQLDYDALIEPSPLLRETLAAVELPRFVFTNADTKHAVECLDRLGVADLFQGVIDFETIQGAAKSLPPHKPYPPVVCKPHPLCFELAMQLAGGVSDASQVIFFDDSRRNIKAAGELGMFAVLVGSDEVAEGANAAVMDVPSLHRTLPTLLDNPSVSVHAPALHV